MEGPRILRLEGWAGEPRDFHHPGPGPLTPKNGAPKQGARRLEPQQFGLAAGQG